MKFTSFFKTEKPDYSVGLALSGGGVKGLAHIGALKALQEEDIYPNIIAGTSAGSLAGVLYADGYEPEEILDMFVDKSFKQFAEFTTPKGGLFKTNKFHQFLKKHLRVENFEELRIPVRVVATNVEDGKTEVFEKGPIIPAILASCAFPIVFTPVKIDKHYYIDGGLLKNFPVSVIKKECEHVIGVNVNPITQEKYRSSLLYIAERTFHYASNANTIPDRRICDILIEPKEVTQFSMFNLEHNDEIYKMGYDAVKESLKKRKYASIWDKIKS